MKVFICHSSKDKKFVRTLKDSLNENRIETWLDEDQLDFGDSLVDKLEGALYESSHIVIVLTSASTESDWVKFEFNKAIENKKTGLTNKIIPIKYRECLIPEVLSDLVYADLTDEVVLPDGEKLKFISNGFNDFFLKLVRALRNSDKAISKDEKAEIIKTIKSTEKEIQGLIKTVIRGNFKLIGFNSMESRQKYQKLISEQLNRDSVHEEFRPFLLPASSKSIMRIKIGHEVKFADEFDLKSHGHFAGYREDDLAIQVAKSTRDELKINRNEYYQIEIDQEKCLITFIDKIKTTDSNAS